MQRVYIILLIAVAIITLVISASFIHPLKNKKTEKEIEIDYSDMIMSTPDNVNLEFLPGNFDERNGNCVILGVEFEDNNHDWELVSATQVEPSTNILFSHVFNEKGNIVFDPVIGKFYQKEKYYRFYSVSNVTKYNAS